MNDRYVYAVANSAPARSSLPVVVWVVIVGVAALVGAGVAFVAVMAQRGGAMPSPSPKPLPHASNEDFSAPEPMPAMTPLRVGVLFPSSGPMAAYGEEAFNGLTMAIPKGTRVGGAEVELVLVDNAGTPTGTADAVNQLVVDPHTIGIIGCISSGNTFAAAETTERVHVPLLSPSATNPAVTKLGQLVSRVCFDDDRQGEAGAELAHHLLRDRPNPPQKWRAAMLYDGANEYSQGLASAFEAAWKAAGNEIAIAERFAGGEANFLPHITAIANAKPDVIFIPGYYHEVGAILQQGAESWKGIPIVGGDGWDSPELTAIAGGAIERLDCYFTTHFVADPPDATNAAFIRDYTERFGQAPGALAALGHDAGLVMLLAIQRAAAIAEGRPTPQQVGMAIRETRDVPGVTGLITIAPNGNAIKSPHFARCTPDGFRRVNFK